MCSLCTSPIPSTANELSTPLNLKSIFVAFVGSVFVNVLGKIANTPHPSFPPVSFSIASRWSCFAFGSMYTRPVPFPMWIARGHRRPHANVVPSSLVVPNVPFRMCHDTSASQLPVVGSALKLHGHPHAQLQLWMYSASIFHFVGIDQTSGPEMGIRRPILNRSRNGFRLGPSVPYIHATTIVTRGRMGEATGQGPAILLRRVTIPVAAAVALVVAAAWYATWTSSDFLMALMAPSTIVSSDLVRHAALAVRPNRRNPHGPSPLPVLRRMLLALHARPLHLRVDEPPLDGRDLGRDLCGEARGPDPSPVPSDRRPPRRFRHSCWRTCVYRDVVLDHNSRVDSP